MATSKTPNTPKIDDDFLAGIKNADDTTTKTTNFETRQDRRTVEPAKTSTPATSDKKVLANFKVNESTLKAWKQFCLDHDTNLTDTIKRAMNYYIKNVNNGNVDL